MKRKTLQAKHIPTRAVLESIQYHNGQASFFVIWADDYPFLPIKVLRAKMNKLRNQGLIDSCCNECGAWIALKPKGEALL